MSLLVPGLNPAFNKPPPKAKPKPAPKTVGGHFGPGGEILPGPAPKSTSAPKHSTSSSPPKHSSSPGGCFAAGGEILPASRCKQLGIAPGTQSHTIGAQGQRLAANQKTTPSKPSQSGCFAYGGEILPASQCLNFGIPIGTQSKTITAQGTSVTGHAPPNNVDCLVEGSPGCLPHTIFCQRYPSSCAQNNTYCAKYPANCATGMMPPPPLTQSQLNWFTHLLRVDGHNWIVEGSPYLPGLNAFATDVYVAHDYGANVPPNNISIYTTGLYNGGLSSAEVLFASTNAKHPFVISPMHAAANAVRIPGENVDLTKITDGIYAVPFGIPLHKFNMTTTPGHHYTTGVVTDDKTYTVYSITDKTASPPKTETWAYKGLTNIFWGKTKTVRNGDEWWNTDGTKAPFAVRYDIRVESPTRYYTMTAKGLVKIDPLFIGPTVTDRCYRGTSQGTKMPC